MLLFDHLSETTGEGVAVWLQKPSRRTITATLDSDLDEDWADAGRYFLSFPHIVFRLQYRTKYKVGDLTDQLMLRSLRMGFCTKELKPTGANAIIYNPPLPNIDENLFVCTGVTNYAPTVLQLAKETVADFWGTEFDEGEMGGSINHYEDNGKFLANYKRWAKKTKRKPDWMPKAKSMVKWGTYKEFLDLTLTFPEYISFPWDAEHEDDK